MPSTAEEEKNVHLPTNIHEIGTTVRKISKPPVTTATRPQQIFIIVVADRI
jgi:hypothetical protein